MTFGQLFRKLHPEIEVKENGTCVWLYFDDVNYYPFGAKWWNAEINEELHELLKEQEAVQPKEKAYAWRCGKCDEYLTAIENHRIRFCPYCGKAVKWNER